MQVLNISSDLCQKIYLKQNIKGESINIPDRMCVKGTDLFDEDHLFASQLSIVDLLQLNQSLRVQLYTLYAYYNSCWVCCTLYNLQAVNQSINYLFSLVRQCPE